MDNPGFQPDADAASLPNNLRAGAGGPGPASPPPASSSVDRRNLKNSIRQQQQQQQQQQRVFSVSCRALDGPLTPVHNNNAGEAKAAAAAAAATPPDWPRGRGLVRLGRRRWELRLASDPSPGPGRPRGPAAAAAAASACSPPPAPLLLGLLVAAAAALALAAGAVVFASTVLETRPEPVPAAEPDPRWPPPTDSRPEAPPEPGPEPEVEPELAAVAGRGELAVLGSFRLQLPQEEARRIPAAAVAELLTLVFAGFPGFARAAVAARPAADPASDPAAVRCALAFRSPAPPALAPRVGLHFLGALRPRAGRLWLADRLPVDPRSVFFETAPVAGPAPDPGPAAPTPPPAAWGEWTAWSACGPAGTQQRTRLCRLERGQGDVAADAETCLFLPPPPHPRPLPPGGGGGDLEVRDCSRPNATVDALLGGATRPVGLEPQPPQLLEELTTAQAAAGPLTPATPDIPALSALTLGPRRCDACLPEEVCVALADESLPACRTPMDRADPTGCGGLCRLGRDVCHRLDVDALRCVEDSPCLPEEWRCGNLLCIPHVKRCDGHLNCYDHTDEFDCECNLQTHFHCGNSTSCLPRSKRCDHIIDCWDGSDELNCTQACPGLDEFTCTDGQCIPRLHFCDGLADCLDQSDEPFGCKGACKRHEWQCGNNRCVRKTMVCDGVDDCGDGTDEANCPPGRIQVRTSSSPPPHLTTCDDELRC